MIRIGAAEAKNPSTESTVASWSNGRPAPPTTSLQPSQKLSENDVSGPGGGVIVSGIAITAASDEQCGVEEHPALGPDEYG